MRMRKLTPPPCWDIKYSRHGGCSVRSKLDFSVSINPFGPPQAVESLLFAGESLIRKYPEPFTESLVNAIGAAHDLPTECIIVGNGANELIHLIAQSFRPSRAAIVEPTYTEYFRALSLVGAEIDHWLPVGEDFRPASFESGAAQMVWLCNPNSPTGQLWERNSLMGWIKSESHITFVVDEAFLPFHLNEAKHSLLRAAARLPNLIVLRSFTKFYAIPGLRLGYAVGCRKHIDQLKKHQIPWSVNGVAQQAGLLCLQDSRFASETPGQVKHIVDSLYQRLNEYRDLFHPLPTESIFILSRMNDGRPAGDLAIHLRKHGIPIRIADNFVGLDERYFRVAVRLPDENNRLLSALQDYT